MKDFQLIVIVDYGLGNLGSIANMLKRIGAKPEISADLAVIERADKLILPGVGAFDGGIKNLQARGLIPLLNTKVCHDRTPILGVCLGMQLLTQKSEEGSLAGLGWVDAKTVHFEFDTSNAHLKIPHMGWNTLEVCRPHPLFSGLQAENRFYFAHSYHVVCRNDDQLASTWYGLDFASAVAHDNILGVQFHPEKSHRFGMQLLKNFAEWEYAHV